MFNVLFMFVTPPKHVLQVKVFQKSAIDIVEILVFSVWGPP